MPVDLLIQLLLGPLMTLGTSSITNALTWTQARQTRKANLQNRTVDQLSAARKLAVTAINDMLEALRKDGKERVNATSKYNVDYKKHSADATAWKNGIGNLERQMQGFQQNYAMSSGSCSTEQERLDFYRQELSSLLDFSEVVFGHWQQIGAERVFPGKGSKVGDPSEAHNIMSTLQQTALHHAQMRRDEEIRLKQEQREAEEYQAQGQRQVETRQHQEAERLSLLRQEVVERAERTTAQRAARRAGA